MENIDKPSEVEGRQRRNIPIMPIAAISCDLGAVVLFFCSVGISSIGGYLSSLVGLLLLILTAISPFVAITLGIAALCSGIKNIGKAGVALSVTAIAIPVLFVLVMIVLFSTGVAVIRWM